MCLIQLNAGETFPTLRPEEGAMSLHSHGHEFRNLHGNLFSCLLRSQGLPACVAARGKLVKPKMSMIMNKLNYSLVGLYLLCAPPLKHSFGWHLQLNMPRGLMIVNGSSFSRSKCLRYETTHTVKTIKCAR